jgi:NADH-quinone oxidoreductase subunit A
MGGNGMSTVGTAPTAAEGVNEYASLGLLVLAGVVFFVVAMVANRALSARRPDPAKLATYECGLDPVGGDWAQAQIRYYVYAYLYVLFAVEAVFLFPWAVIFDDPGFGLATVVEMAIFVGVLALGLAYAWRKRVLRWT